MGVGGLRLAHVALLLGKTRYLLYRRLGVPQGRSGRMPPPRFDPRTVHPLASRYTDWATPAHKFTKVYIQNVKARDHYEDVGIKER